MTLAADIVHALTTSNRRIAVAESLTGGLLTSALVDVPGASAAVNGGIVSYRTALKHSVLNVDAELLRRKGAVHPEVARQMARGVRDALIEDGQVPEVGIATTGVAGPEHQDGKAVGTVFIGISLASGDSVVPLRLFGDRQTIRKRAVQAALEALLPLL